MYQQPNVLSMNVVQPSCSRMLVEPRTPALTIMCENYWVAYARIGEHVQLMVAVAASAVRCCGLDVSTSRHVFTNAGKLSTNLSDTSFVLADTSHGS